MKKEETEQQKPKKKGRGKWIIIIVVVIIVLVLVFAAFGTDTSDEAETQDTTVSESVEDESEVEEETEEEKTEPEQDEDKLTYGELLSVTENEIDGKNIVVVKGKITSSYSNNATIEQNYFNVSDLITECGYDRYDEIQYWAVADMSDGSEQKVISFTVDSNLIQKIAAEELAPIQLGDYVSDLWIHQSLRED